MTTPSDSHFAPVSGQQPVHDPVGSPDTSGQQPTVDGEEIVEEEQRRRNWLGISAFVTGVLGLSVVAIVLGHLGLSAVKKGRATNRPWALAGTILGYIGLAATLALGAAYYAGVVDQWQGSTHDAHAQADVNAVGREMALAWADTGEAPVVVQGSGEYVVNSTTIDAQLTVDATLTDSIVSPVSWCVMIAYEGGNQDAYTYLPDQGVVEGAQCEAPAEPSPEPSPSSSPEPSGSPSPEPTATDEP